MADDRKPIDIALDLLIYAPVGASVEFLDRLPELAKLGRERLSSQAPTARLVGKFAVSAGLSKLGEFAASGREATSQAPDSATDRSETTASIESSPEPESAVVIDDYDELTAATIVPMLAALTDESRSAIRTHELAGRSRRTILAKLDRLEANQDTPRG